MSSGAVFPWGVPWRQGHRTPPELTEQVALAVPGCPGFQALWLQSLFLLSVSGLPCVLAGPLLGGLCAGCRWPRRGSVSCLGRLHSDRGAGSVTGSLLLVLCATLRGLPAGWSRWGDRLVSSVTAAALCLCTFFLFLAW